MEHAVVSSSGWRSNADDTRLAGSSEGWVQIRSTDKEKLLAMLPVPGIAFHASWDASNPDLIAVSSFLPENLRVANNGHKYAIFVWLVNAKDARLIRTYPAQRGYFRFDNGYRLFCFADDGVKAHSLVDQKQWNVPDSAKESFSHGAMSPNGRYLTTYSVPDQQTQYSILDLKEGKLVQAIHGPERIQWSADSTKLAGYFREPNRNNTVSPLGSIRIIDVVTGDTLREINPDHYSLAASRLAFSPDFEVLANSGSGGVLLMEIKSGRKSKLDASGRLRWLDDSRLEITSSGKKQNFLRQHGIVGKLTSVVEEKVPAKTTELTRSSIRHLSMLKDGTLRMIAGKYPHDSSDESSFYSVQVGNEKAKQIQPIWGHFINARFLAGEDVFSPSGKFVVQIGRDSGRRTGSRHGSYSADVWVQNLETGTDSVNIGTFKSISQLAWSKDEKHLAVDGWQQTRRRSALGARIIDLQTMEPVQIKEVWDQAASEFIPMGPGFLCAVSKHVRGAWTAKLAWVDPSATEKSKMFIDVGALNGLEEFRSATLGHDTNGRPIVRIQPKVETKPSQQFEVLDDFKLKKLDTKLQFRKVQPGQMFGIKEDLPSIYRDLQINSAVRHSARWNLLCLGGRDGKTFFDLEKRKCFGPMSLHYPEHATPVPCKDGWILWNENTISVFDFDGELIKRRFLYVDKESGLPTVTGWVHSNGDGADQLRKDHPDRNRFPKVVFADGIYRIE